MTVDRYDNGRGTATHLLQHYFRFVAQEAGVKWDRDNDSEVAQIVDALLQAARQENATQPQAQRPALLSAMFPEEETPGDYACADCGAIGTFPESAPHDACAECGSSNVITSEVGRLTAMWQRREDATHGAESERQ